MLALFFYDLASSAPAPGKQDPSFISPSPCHCFCTVTVTEQVEGSHVSPLRKSGMNLTMVMRSWLYLLPRAARRQHACSSCWKTILPQQSLAKPEGTCGTAISTGVPSGINESHPFCVSRQRRYAHPTLAGRPRRRCPTRSRGAQPEHGLPCKVRWAAAAAYEERGCVQEAW